MRPIKVNFPPCPKSAPREFWTQCGDKARMLGLESAGITEGEAVFGSTNGDAV